MNTEKLWQEVESLVEYASTLTVDTPDENSFVWQQCENIIFVLERAKKRAMKLEKEFNSKITLEK